MDARKSAALIGILVLLLSISSCGEPEPQGVCPASCDDNDVCTKDVCSKDTGFQCRNTPIEGCNPACGAPCTGQAGKYMTMQCDVEAKKCAADVSKSLKVSPVPILLEQLLKGFNFRVEMVMNQPFNMQRDTVQMKISSTAIPAGVSSLKIKSAELSGLNAAKQTLIIARKDIGKTIYSSSDIVSDEMRVDFPTADYDGIFTGLKLTVYVEYSQLVYGKMQSFEDKVQMLIRSQSLEWLRPTITPKCPASCDDNDPATDDSCSQATGYFCVHTPKAGVCGNQVCDSGEDKCACPEDCGPCSGDASANMVYQCSSSNQCVTLLKPGVQQPVSVFDDRNLNIFHIQGTFSYNNPLNVKADTFSAEFKLFNIGALYQNVKIATVKLMDMDKEIASVDPNRVFTSVGDTFTAELPITSFAGTEEDKSVTLKVWYEYDQMAGNVSTHKLGNYAKGLGKITLVNPTG